MLNVLDSTTSRKNPRTTTPKKTGFFMNPTGLIHGKWIHSWFIIILFGEDPINGLLEAATATALGCGLR
jgi:hypothetical protein